MNSFTKHFRRNLVAAQENKSTTTMRCLTDGAGHKLAQKMYQTYIDEEDFSRFPAFMSELDALLVRHGGGKQDEGEGEEDSDKE